MHKRVATVMRPNITISKYVDKEAQEVSEQCKEKAANAKQELVEAPSFQHFAARSGKVIRSSSNKVEESHPVERVKETGKPA